MNLQLKNVLGGLLAVALVVSMYAAVVFANAYSNSIDPSSLRSFEVTAEGEVVAIPDIGRFTFSIITEGGIDLAALQEENTESVNAVIEFLKENNVDTKDIKTTAYNVEPRYQFSRPPREGGPIAPPEIVGYTVRQVARVTVRDLGSAGDLLAGAVTHGANAVSQLSFEVDDLEAAQNDARADAITKAKEKAKALADAGGFRLGKVISLREGGSFIPQARFFDASTETIAFGGAPSAPTIEPGSQDVRMSVTIVYEIR